MSTKVTSPAVTSKRLCCLSEGGTGLAFSHQQPYLRLKYLRDTRTAEVQPLLPEPPYRKQVLFLQMFRLFFFSFLFYSNGVKVQSSSEKCFV